MRGFKSKKKNIRVRIQDSPVTLGKSIYEFSAQMNHKKCNNFIDVETFESLLEKLTDI